jgi:hypothetical protein
MNFHKNKKVYGLIRKDMISSSSVHIKELDRLDNKLLNSF